MIFVWVNKRNWRHPGPIVNVSVHNAYSLAELGYETHLCLGEGKPSETSRDLQEIYDLSALPYFHIHRIAKKRLGKTEISLSVFQDAEKLVRELRQRDAVAVITREAAFLPFLAKLCRNGNVLGFYEAHDFYADLFWREDRLSFQDYKQELVERIFLPRISGLICITEPQQKLYQRLFPNLVSVSLPLGTKLQNAADWEARRLLRKVVYVGHLDRAKGVTDLVKMATALGERQVQMVLWGGSNEQIQRFQNLIEKTGASQKVECVGFRPFTELYRALASEVSLGLVPLQDTFYNRYLTCPAKALDYLSHSLPVIASDLPGVRTLLQEGAHYFPLSQPEALADWCEELLEDRGKYSGASQQAEKRAKTLTWTNRAKCLVQFVESFS